MTVATEARADDFSRLTDPFRGELLAHCYRMLGSLHDAEDLVQETYLRAWRGYDGFEGRSSLRTWLYRIATRVCLRALETRGRRALPSGLAGPSDDPARSLGSALPEVTWLEPFPDALTDPESADPAAIAVSREGTRLALVAALQHLPGRQRAVLILRDVLKWRAAEVADLLDTTTTAVNSALQRARAQLDRIGGVDDASTELADPDQQDLLDRYVAAFETADIASLVRLLRTDAALEMPPFPAWFRGPQAIGRFLQPRLGAPGDIRMVSIRANGAPAHALYTRGQDGVHHAHGIVVLTVRGSGIARITAFQDPDLFPAFELPSIWSGDATS